MGMDTDALRWFQQVADGSTVTEVSELETVTQSGVSRALARLEEQVGVALLYRSGRTLRMTHAGAVFKRHVDALLHSLDDGLAALSELLDPDTGTVVLAFQHSHGTWLVPDLVRGFRAEHPGVRFELHQVRDEIGSPVLYGGRADLEISSRPRHDPQVLSRVIALEPLRLITSRDHPLAGRPSISLAEVAEEPFVSLRPRSALRKLTDELCGRAGFSPDIVFEGDDLTTVRGFVAAGLGVAVVPAPRAASAERTVSYLAIEDPAAVREISLIWSSDRRLLPAAEQFRQYIIRRGRSGALSGASAASGASDGPSLGLFAQRWAIAGRWCGGASRPAQLLAAPHRVALLGERGRALARVSGAEDPGGDRRLPTPSLGDRPVLTPARDRLGRGHRQRAVSRDREGQVERRRQRLAFGHDAIDQADLGCPVGVDRISGQEQLESQRQRQAPRQQQRAPGRGHQRPLDLRHPEASRPRRDDQVAGQHELEASRECPALDGREQRLPRRGFGDAAETATFEVGGFTVEESLEIHPGRERATGASENRGPQLVVRVQLIGRVSKALGDGPVERVPRVRAIDRDHQHRVATLGDNLLCCHASSPLPHVSGTF